MAVCAYFILSKTSCAFTSSRINQQMHACQFFFPSKGRTQVHVSICMSFCLKCYSTNVDVCMCWESTLFPVDSGMQKLTCCIALHQSYCPLSLLCDWNSCLQVNNYKDLKNHQRNVHFCSQSSSVKCYSQYNSGTL